MADASVENVAPAPRGGTTNSLTPSCDPFSRACVPAATSWSDQCENWAEDAERVPIPLKQRGVTLSTWRRYRKRRKLRSEAKSRLLMNIAESEESVWDDLARRLLTKVQEDAGWNPSFEVKAELKATEAGMEAAPASRAELQASADSAPAQIRCDHADCDNTKVGGNGVSKLLNRAAQTLRNVPYQH